MINMFYLLILGNFDKIVVCLVRTSNSTTIEVKL